MGELDTISAALARFFEEHEELPVDSVYLFGSAARGEVHRESDVDVALLVEAGIGRNPAAAFELRVMVSSQLIAQLQRNEIDVVVLQQLPPLFARDIVTGGIRVFCRNPRADHEFARHIQSRAADLAPFIQRGRARLLEELSR